MTIRNPNLDEEIIGYDKLQTAEINKVADYVIDFGSNANGSWEKWNSGKLIQKSHLLATNGTTIQQGGVFISATVQNIDFPIPFVGLPNILVQSQGVAAFGILLAKRDPAYFQFRLIHYVNQSVVEYIFYEAEGTWK